MMRLRQKIFGGWTPTPKWVHEKEMSREEAIALMQEYIETVIERYAGTIDEWIVVNEPLGSQFGARRVDGVLLAPNVWFEKIGPDYIKFAFEHARRVDPDSRLIINDWGADFLGQDYSKHDRGGEYYKLVAYLIEQGTPIDGVGFQFHLEPGLDYPRVRAVVENFERYIPRSRAFGSNSPHTRRARRTRTEQVPPVHLGVVHAET